MRIGQQCLERADTSSMVWNLQPGRQMDEMKRWLEGLSLGQYAQSFAANDVDFDVLPDLTEAELERLGVSLGHRKRLRRFIAAGAPRVGKLPPSLAAPLVAMRPATEPQPEKRQVTVMFCDLVGSTEMSARLDAEDLRHALRTYQRVCAEVIRSFEGFIAQFLGDGILAYFGYPCAHEGEAERAVRAGLAMLASTAQIVAESKIELEMRIGIASGPTVIGDLIGHGAAAQIAITGKTPNLAARIKEIAQPGTLVITESTRRLVAGHFEYEDLGPQRLKGISEPVRGWRVVRELSDVEQFEAKRITLVDCVGRYRELRLLLDRWQMTTAGTGQAIVISGEAGIGKTRLVTLLREQLPANAQTHICLQCAQQYRNSPLHPLIIHLRRAAGVKGDDSPESKLGKIERLLATAGSSYGAPLVAELLSVPLEDHHVPLARSPARQRAKTMELLIGQLFGLAAQKPVLLVVEDAHWLDPTTEEMLIHLLDRLHEHRIMMLLTTRPDCASSLVDHPHAMTLMLGRLDPDDARQMISEVSGCRTLSAEVTELILVKTDGVPLFIEELTKDVLESGQLQLDEAKHLQNGRFSDLSIPSTLADTLRARIDRLSSVKDVMHVGAAIGRSFPFVIIRAVMSLDDDMLRLALDRLVEAKLIYQHGAPPDAVYVFKHVLLQDAAYESMLRGQRISLHTRIVAVIEKQFPEIAETEPELVAHHCSRAELGEKAVNYWLKAGAGAVSRSANLEAINHLRNGLQQLHAIASEQERAHLELELQLTLGQALIAAQGYTAGETALAFLRAEQLVEKIGNAGQRYSALYGIFVGRLIGGHIDAASETIDRMHRLASSGEDDAYMCLAYRLRGSLSFFRGDLHSAHAELQKAIALYAPSQGRLALHFGPDTGPAALIFLAMTEWLRGGPDRALRTAQIAIADARKLENALTLGQVLTLAAQLHYMSQDYEGMFHLAKQGGDNCEQNGVRYFGAICQLYQIWARARLSNPADYIDDFRRGLAAYEKMGAGLQVALFRVMLAQLLLAAGRSAEAAEETETALAMITLNGERWWAPEIHRTLGHALLGFLNPDVAEAENCFRRGVAEAREIGALTLELRAAKSLAEILIGRGDRGGAQQTLATVVAQFSEGFDGGDLRTAMKFLGETSQAALVGPEVESRHLGFETGRMATASS
jgi:class 3 adenylate cyclase/predicted ATPase/ABC-type transport system involved in cytochrome c biogenesis ATPase subunit